MLGLLLISLLIGASPAVITHARAAGVLMAIMGAERPAPLTWLEYPVTDSVEQLPLASGAVRARRYLPVGKQDAPPIVLVPGVHPQGIDEARLRAFARAMAQAGIDVVTPGVPELARFQVTEATLPRITETARYHARRTGRTTSGVIGISFAGGLALIAASQPHEPWASFIVTVGSHHSLSRLTRYYAGETITGPQGEHQSSTAHPYGARVLIHAHAEHFFEHHDVPLARKLLERWIAGDAKGARASVSQLSSEASRAAMTEVLDFNNKAPLGRQILAAMHEERAALAAASPEGKLATVKVPVFVVHGVHDPIIPSTESRWLAHELPPESLAQAVITPIIRHAELPNKPTTGTYLELIAFEGAILTAAEAQ